MIDSTCIHDSSFSCGGGGGAQREDGNQTLLFNLVYHLITSSKTHNIYEEISAPPPMSCACIKIEILLYSNAQ